MVKMAFSVWVSVVSIATMVIAKDARQVVYLDMSHVFDNTTQFWGPGTQIPPTLDDSISEDDDRW